jgi:hypothetical protein
MMGPQHALVALLSLASAANAQYFYSSESYTSAFWTYTSRYAAIVSPSPYTRTNGIVTTYTQTDRRRIVKPTVVPTATPTSVTTYYSTYANLEIEYQYFGLNAVAESDLVPEEDLYATATKSSISVSSTITFYMPVTMTAPASCPTPFTVTTTASVTVPSQVWSLITPSSKVDGGATTRGNYYAYSVQTWYLSAGAAPFTSTSDVNWRYYIKSCDVPPAARTSEARTTGTSSGGGSSSGNNNNFSGYDTCYRFSYYCGTPFRVWIIVIATVLPGLFLLGFLESWFWFRRLMTGKSAMRVGTVCWVLLLLWIMCFTRMQDARSKEDQVLLREKWKAMGSGAAFKAWMKWGLRRAYPVEHLGQYSSSTVGIVPEGQPINPAMAQTQNGFMPPPPAGAPGQVYYYGPPPPGWVSTPDGQGFMPPQSYYAPQNPQYAPQAYKSQPVVSTSPVSQQQTGPQLPTMAPHQPISPISTPPPQQAQTAHVTPGAPPQGPLPTPPTHVSEAPATAPVARDSEAPTNAPPANTAPPPPHKNDPNDRSLYE